MHHLCLREYINLQNTFGNFCKSSCLNHQVTILYLNTKHKTVYLEYLMIFTLDCRNCHFIGTYILKYLNLLGNLVLHRFIKLPQPYTYYWAGLSSRSKKNLAKAHHGLGGFFDWWFKKRLSIGLTTSMAQWCGLRLEWDVAGSIPTRSTLEFYDF